MTWIVKYWKPIAIAALLAAVVGGEYWYGEQRYSAGYRAAETKLKQQQTEALAKQTGAVLEKERQAQAELAAAQAEVEKERQDAKIAVDNLRGELDRLRQHAARQSGSRNLPATAPSARASDGEEVAKGWALFGKCAAEYAGMAEVADQQRNDLAEWQAYGRIVSGE